MIQSFDNPEALAAAAAGDWLNELATRAAASTPYSVALSGGRITRNFFRAVVEQGRTRAELFREVHFFWADERCVPPTDDESNFRMAEELLLCPLGIASEQVHRIPGEEESAHAADMAARDLAAFFAARGGRDNVFDRIFLGMGEDGHTASLFPGESKETMNNPALYRAVVAEKPPPDRVTLGYDALIAARNVVVLASGAGKEAALKESLSPDGGTPMARVLRNRKDTRILTDVRL